MHVASGGVACGARQGNDFSSLHVLAGSNKHLRIVAVSGMHVISVIEGDPQARVAGPVGDDYSTGFAGVDRGAAGNGVILSNMDLVPCTRWICAPTIRARNSPGRDRMHQLKPSGQFAHRPNSSCQ
ncbi:hypothetical protein GCM10007173_19860 [Glutamicibacter ardleyensis]|uniref:Uncharacterized protein n=1 Tax=Glutamicibacter ardleyensis TaxID=225894 RepID=A0ABQ2DN71_9MICC|nr:hypothetical protein GCM10007173_19860 [Glutamicibacter ardleyensis]